MNQLTKTPRADRLAPGSAGRSGRLSREFPQADYHRRGSGASAKGRLLVAVTPQGVKKTGLLVQRQGAKVLVRKVSFERHLLRLPEPSWAVDWQKVEEAAAEAVERVEVHDERGRVWWTSLRHLIERGQRFDRGWGEQVRLPLTQWSFLPSENAAQLRLLEVGT